jgi:tripartite-type tricarboxylate transporter receptor subunit TctC
MQIGRRGLVRLVLGSSLVLNLSLDVCLLGLAGFICSISVQAQDYPNRPIRLIVPYPPGGAGDTMARTIAPPMARALGQNILIESRPGANTVIGTELLVRAPANGYSALVIAPSFTVNPFVHSKLPYDTPRDFSGVTRMVYNPLIICAHPTLPAKNIQELVQLAKKRPGELTWGVSSIIGGGRIAGELFAEAAKIRMINVPFGGGGPAVTAVLGGHTSLIVGNVLECAHHAQSGRLRALAVTSPQRASMLPQVPTVAESGWSGFEALNWFSIVVRAGTPGALIERLAFEVGRALQSAESAAVLAKQGFSLGLMSPSDFDEYLIKEMPRNSAIVKKLNLKLD